MNIRIIRRIFQIGFLKTIYFNFYYFGINGGFPVIVARNIVLRELGGTVLLSNRKMGIVKLGFGDVGIYNFKTDKGVWENGGTIHFEGKCNIGLSSKISCKKGGNITFGRNFVATADAKFIAHKKIIFGQDCLVSWDTLFMDTDFHKIMNPAYEIKNQDKDIEIGNHVWIGCKSVVLKGAVIPENCVVGAMSLVNKKIENKASIIGGRNEILKMDIKWET